MRVILVLGLLLPLSVPASAVEFKCPSPVTRLIIQQGEYSPVPGTLFRLSNFRANMVWRGKRSPLCFQRWTEISQAEIFVSADGLTKMFDRKVKESNPKSSISDLKIETKSGNKVHLSGKIKKLIPMPFSIEGPVTTDGRTLQLRAESIKAAGIPVKGLLDALGKQLSSMLHSESVDGVVAKGDLLIFQPELICHVRGHLVKVVATEKGLGVQFAETPGQQKANSTDVMSGQKQKDQ